MAYPTALVLLSLILTSAALQSEITTEEANGQNFLDGMLINYDNRVPPNGNKGEGSPVVVTSSIYILDVEKVDDHNEMFKASFYFRQRWNDSRLRFDSEDVREKYIYVKEPDRVWRPDLFFAQEREARFHNVVAPNVFMKLSSDGSILYSVRITATFACRMDLRKFPFDTQKCSFNAESYGHNTKSIDLGWDYRFGFAAVSYDDNISLREFDLLDVVPSIDTVTLRTNEYRRLNLIFTFQRKTTYYAIRLFVPFILLTSLSWITFWIKPKIISLRLTLLLAVFYLMVEIGRDTNAYFVTATAYTKGSDVWIAVCESLVFASLLEFILVSILTKNEKKLKKHQRCDEIPISIDVEAKMDATVIKTDSMTSSAKFVARNLSRAKKLSKRIDHASKFLFPIVFAIFNIVYWSVYCAN